MLQSKLQMRQVISGMSDAELFECIGKSLLKDEPRPAAPEGLTASSSQDCQPPAADQGQLQAAGEVVANVPKEPAMHAMPVLDTPGPGEEPAMQPGPEEELQWPSCQSDLAGYSPLGDWGGIRVP